MTVALVLGAAVRPDGTPSPTLRLRVRHAVSLYRAGHVQQICVAGGQGRHGDAEGIVGVDLARRMGVPDAALLAETRSRNTVENLTYSAPLLGGQDIVIVSNRWHLPRAALAARLMRMPAQTTGPRGQMSWAKTFRAALREAVAMPTTALRAIRWARRSGP